MAGPMMPSASICSISRAARVYPIRSRRCSIEIDARPGVCAPVRPPRDTSGLAPPALPSPPRSPFASAARQPEGRLLARRSAQVPSVSAGKSPPVLDCPLDLVIGDKHALQANRGRRIRRLEEHIAAAEQSLGSGLIEDHPAVDAGGHRKGDARREIGLDQAGDNIHRWALGGDDQVNAGRAGQLGQAGDQPLGLVRERTSSDRPVHR